MPKIEQDSAEVLTVRYDNISAGWEAWVLLRSDAHHDSPYCDRKTERKHLEMAKERDALILDAGDLFDAMQGKFDPRRTMDDVRPENKVADYYGSIARCAAEDYAPYVENFVMVGKGNHETAVLDKANTDLTSNLVLLLNTELLKMQVDHTIFAGDYEGWVRFMFNIHGRRRHTIRMKWNHGNGGTAPVTRGVIHTNRQAVFLDADIVWNGHNHQGYILPIKRERLNTKGRIEQNLIWFLRTPGYKGGGDNYSKEKNTGPAMIGSIWLHFYLDGKFVSVKPIPEFV
jgi:hypothetical protein